MSERKEQLLKEAADPKTDPKRLRKISEKHSAFSSVIAANPGCDELLLLVLAAHYPAEVVNNPAFQLILLEGREWWIDCNAFSLVNLLAHMGRQGPEIARKHLFIVLQDALSNIKKNYQGEVTWSFDIEVEIVSKLTATMRSDDIRDGDSNSTFEMATKKTIAIKADCCFNAFFELVEGEPPENPNQLLEILEGIGSCGGASEEYLGWHVEQQSSEGASWHFDVLNESEWKIHEGFSSDGIWGAEISDQVGNKVFIAVNPMDYEWNEVWNIPGIAKQLMGPNFHLEGDISGVTEIVRLALCLQ